MPKMKNQVYQTPALPPLPLVPPAVLVPSLAVIPDSNLFYSRPMPPPVPPMRFMSNLFGPHGIEPGQAPFKPIKMIPWRPLPNNGRGTAPEDRMTLHKVKIHKSLRKMMGGKKPANEFDYGVEYKKPKKVSAPMSPKKHQIVQGYNADGSLRFAPSFVPEVDRNILPKLSTKNDFIHYDPSHEHEGRKFTLFSILPIEIRRRIWKYALPSDRIIMIDRIDRLDPYYIPSLYASGAKRGPFTIKTSYPGLLGACKESRTLGFESYKLSFGHRLEGRPIYFDFSRDVIFFGDTQALSQFTGTSFYESDVDAQYDIRLTGDLLATERIIVGGRLKRDTIHILGLFANLRSVTFEKQYFMTSQGPRTAPQREMMAMTDLWARKKDGGSGLPGVNVSFETEQLLEVVGSSVVWRKGMLDM